MNQWRIVDNKILILEGSGGQDSFLKTFGGLYKSLQFGDEKGEYKNIYLLVKSLSNSNY